jgi:HPt (histidine-containing phosphotransfer) domain-containing protein
MMNTRNSLIDLERLESIGALNDPEVAALIRCFTSTLSRKIEDIRAAHESADSSSLKFLVHRLKGTCLTCCLTKLADCLAEWEKSGLASEAGHMEKIEEIAHGSSLAMESILADLDF